MDGNLRDLGNTDEEPNVSVEVDENEENQKEVEEKPDQNEAVDVDEVMEEVLEPVENEEKPKESEGETIETEETQEEVTEKPKEGGDQLEEGQNQPEEDQEAQEKLAELQDQPKEGEEERKEEGDQLEGGQEAEEKPEELQDQPEEGGDQLEGGPEAQEQPEDGANQAEEGQEQLQKGKKRQKKTKKAPVRPEDKPNIRNNGVYYFNKSGNVPELYRVRMYGEPKAPIRFMDGLVVNPIPLMLPNESYPGCMAGFSRATVDPPLRLSGPFLVPQVPRTVYRRDITPEPESQSSGEEGRLVIDENLASSESSVHAPSDERPKTRFDIDDSRVNVLDNEIHSNPQNQFHFGHSPDEPCNPQTCNPTTCRYDDVYLKMRRLELEGRVRGPNDQAFAASTDESRDKYRENIMDTIFLHEHQLIGYQRERTTGYCLYCYNSNVALHGELELCQDCLVRTCKKWMDWETCYDMDDLVRGVCKLMDLQRGIIRDMDIVETDDFALAPPEAVPFYGRLEPHLPLPGPVPFSSYRRHRHPAVDYRRPGRCVRCHSWATVVKNPTTASPLCSQCRSKFKKELRQCNICLKPASCGDTLFAGEVICMDCRKNPKRCLYNLQHHRLPRPEEKTTKKRGRPKAVLVPSPLLIDPNDPERKRKIEKQEADRKRRYAAREIKTEEGNDEENENEEEEDVEMEDEEEMDISLNVRLPESVLTPQANQRIDLPPHPLIERRRPGRPITIRTPQPAAHHAPAQSPRGRGRPPKIPKTPVVQEPHPSFQSLLDEHRERTSISELNLSQQPSTSASSSQKPSTLKLTSQVLSPQPSTSGVVPKKQKVSGLEAHKTTTANADSQKSSTSKASPKKPPASSSDFQKPSPSKASSKTASESPEPLPQLRSSTRSTNQRFSASLKRRRPSHDEDRDFGSSAPKRPNTKDRK